jgi:hypothetical protein
MNYHFVSEIRYIRNLDKLHLHLGIVPKDIKIQDGIAVSIECDSKGNVPKKMLLKALKEMADLFSSEKYK